ncbi:MAG: FHA domain-containing protein [Deltaproteobacteria bacterium]|nr:FHA domain-containing protein [Deltaproteobacteria bacterium]
MAEERRKKTAAPRASESTRLFEAPSRGQDRVVVVWPGGVASAPRDRERLLILGRDDSCDLQVDHPSVSRRHVTLQRTHAGVLVEELGSRNGTYVVDVRLKKRSPRELMGGLPLRLGEALVLVQRALRSGRTRERGAALDEQIVLLAAGDVPLFLQGEYGVRKWSLATRIHGASPRRARPLIRIDCVGIDDLELLNAVSLALEDEPGVLAGREPHGARGLAGTLVLTDVHERSLAAQSRLVRALNSETSLGRVRVIATCSCDLESMTRTGAFRLDLFHRLAGHVARVLPLRDRPDEVEVHARSLAATVGESRPVAAHVLERRSRRAEASCWARQHARASQRGDRRRLARSRGRHPARAPRSALEGERAPERRACR